jgi:hypothetical protein
MVVPTAIFFFFIARSCSCCAVVISLVTHNASLVEYHRLTRQLAQTKETQTLIRGIYCPYVPLSSCTDRRGSRIINFSSWAKFPLPDNCHISLPYHVYNFLNTQTLHPEDGGSMDLYPVFKTTKFHVFTCSVSYSPTNSLTKAIPAKMFVMELVKKGLVCSKILTLNRIWRHLIMGHIFTLISSQISWRK